MHIQGITSSKEANREIGHLIKKGKPLKMDVPTSNLLGNFIILAHEKFKLPYETMFSKCSISEFMDRCWYVLGNYDDKLIRTYLM